MVAAFCCLLSFLLFSFMFNTSLSHIRFSCLDVCFIIFGQSCFFEYKFAKLLKVCLLKIVIENW